MLNSKLISSLLIISLVLFWQAVVSFSPTLQHALPSPLQIVQCLQEQRQRLFFHTFVTLLEMVSGFLIALCFAFPLAWAMMQLKSVRLALQSVFVFLQCVPMFALAPLMVIWFGWSFSAIAVSTALMIFFPITMNIYKGLMSTPKPLLQYFQLNQATKLQTFFKLRLPYALPFFFTGLRVSAAVAGCGAVAGEWAGGQSGLGVLMLESRRGQDLEMMFAALFCLTALTLIFYLLPIALEKLASLKNFVPKRAALSAILLSMLCFGCSQGDQSKVGLLLDWFPNPNHVPLFVGVEMGIFQKHGINLQIIKNHDPGDVTAYLDTNKCQFALSYATHTCRAQERGAAVKPIAVLIASPLNAVLYKKDLLIEKPEDLSGKTIGYCIDGTDRAYFDYLLRQNHIKPLETRNVSFDPVGVLLQNQVDAVYGIYWNIEKEQLETLGIDLGYFTVEELGVPAYDELVVLSNQSSLDESFVKALKESIAFCRENPDKAFACYKKANPDKRAKTLVWEEKAWKKTLQVLATSQTIDENRWGRLKDWLRENWLL